MSKKSIVSKEIKSKLNVLNPKFKNQIEKMFSNINQSISMLYEVATQDEKTGIYNNRFLQTLFKMEIEKAKRGYQKLSLFIADIDFFKKINDTHGHIKADELLKELAQLFKKQTRKSDVIARFGGEEFVILLPETNLKQAKIVTSRIRKKIQSNKKLKKYNLTISGGLTEYKKLDTIKKMMIKADKGLYFAKKSGRNQLVAIEQNQKPKTYSKDK